MDVKELRVGNYFIPITDNGYELEPRKIKVSEFLLLSERPEKAKPIPLTEEWLIKFGFEMVQMDSNSGKYEVYSKYKLTYNTFHGWWLFNKRLDRTPVKYVHQLQNLYFALTGEELPIKL